MSRDSTLSPIQKLLVSEQIKFADLIKRNIAAEAIDSLDSEALVDRCESQAEEVGALKALQALNETIREHQAFLDGANLDDTDRQRILTA